MLDPQVHATIIEVSWDLVSLTQTETEEGDNGARKLAKRFTQVYQIILDAVQPGDEISTHYP